MEARGCKMSTSADAPSFPPIFIAHEIPPADDMSAAGVRVAIAGSFAARDVLWQRDEARVNLAIVLEPEVSALVAQQMGLVMALAVTESLGALMPAQTAVQLRWPDRILVNGGDIGCVTLTLPDCDEHQVPDRLVVQVDLQLGAPEQTGEPGDHPQQTWLLAEGGDYELVSARYLSSIAAHFLNWLNTWTDDGFQPVAAQLIGRVEGYEDAATITARGSRVDGRVIGLGDDLGVIVKTARGDAVPVPYDWQVVRTTKVDDRAQ